MKAIAMRLMAGVDRIVVSKATESLESSGIRHGGSEQDLQLGLSSSSIARLVRAEVLEVIDIALDDRPPSQLASSL
ncbi:hypothetical protein BH20ACT22_BH20ACT22_20360 [soil metagenome]